MNLDIDKLIRRAHSYGMEVLLECYDKEEAQKALRTEADIIGINNRDLKTLKVDLNQTREMMEYLRTQSLNRPVISESGIKSNKDAEFVRAQGINGILVGTAIWTANDQYAKITELRLSGEEQ
jgi:indole-3-glycerol phosphate synthase